MFRNQSERCNLSLTEGVVLFHKVAYIPVFAAGLLLNSVALYIFFLRRASWTETHVYMINLALADFILILFLPFRIYNIFNHSVVWDFCPFLISVHYLTMYASIFTLTAISVHRFAAVRFPFSARAGGGRKRMALVLCALVWVVVVATCAVFNGVNGTDNLQFCFERVAEPLPLPFVLVLSIAGFLLPLCTVLFCSSQTILSLLTDKEASAREEKRKCVTIVAANLFVFVVCYAPFHVALVAKFGIATQSPCGSNCATYNLAQNIFFVSDWIATTNCCLDSIAYYFLFRNFTHN